MPRIRTVKPEFCTSEQVAECSTTARLLFILMWLHCDDAGRHPDSVKRIKMECLPGDSFSDAEVQAFVDELVSADLIVRYQYEGKRFLQVTGWEKHQKIDRPSYRHPPLSSAGTPVPIHKFDEHSTTCQRHVAELSPPEPTGSLQGRISAAAKAAVAEWSQTDWQEVTLAANKLRKAARTLKPDFVWNVCAIGETIAPGMIAEIVTRIANRDVKKPKSYLESALRAEAEKLGFDWRELVPIVPPPRLETQTCAANL